ncbi:MAG TPA: hypothetical protein VGG12_08985 [Methylovirgula sp.]
MAFDRLTWVGLMIVALGWALLLSGASSIDALAHLVGLQTVPVNLGTLSQATMLTGFGLAILGALQTGFGALKRFFDLILERTARTAPKMTVDMPRAEKTSIVERGLLRDRPYVLFGDGSIEVETLLGMRRFTSLQDAYEFIGN